MKFSQYNRNNASTNDVQQNDFDKKKNNEKNNCSTIAIFANIQSHCHAMPHIDEYEILIHCEHDMQKSAHFIGVLK